MGNRPFGKYFSGKKRSVNYVMISLFRFRWFIAYIQIHDNAWSYSSFLNHFTPVRMSLSGVRLHNYRFPDDHFVMITFMMFACLHSIQLLRPLDDTNIQAH